MRAAVQQSDTQNRLTRQLLSDRVSELRVRTHIEQQLQQATQQHVDTTQHPDRQTDCDSCWTVYFMNVCIFRRFVFMNVSSNLFCHDHVCFFSLFSYLLMNLIKYTPVILTTDHQLRFWPWPGSSDGFLQHLQDLQSTRLLRWVSDLQVAQHHPLHPS